jgi:iron complex outermembrane receptor protein
MERTVFIGLMTLGFLMLAASARAQAEASSKGEESETSVIREMVVTASRYEEAVESVPTNVSVITEQDIANSTAKDIPGLIQQEVGLHVYDITGNRRSYRVDRSGFGETAVLNTLVLVDGRRVNNPDLSGADWMLISLDRVKRIEIVRGSRGSVLYGDNATDSVINIITKEGEDQFKTELKATGGSYSTFGASASASGMYNEVSYELSGSYYESDGYRDNSHTDPRDIGLNLGYFIGDAAKVSLSGGYHKDKTGLPGALRQSELDAGISRTSSTHPADYADTEDHYVQLNPEIFFLQDSYFKAPFSYKERDQTAFATFVGGQFDSDTQIKTATVSPQFVVKEPVGGLFDNNLTLGLDYYYFDEDIVNESLFFGTLTIGRFDLKKKNYGLYIHDEFYPLSKLALSAGYRHDKVKYAFSPTSPDTPDDTDYDVNLVTAGINYKFHEKSYLYFSFSEGFRYPVLDEIFSFYTNTINANLVPQTSDDYEMGVRHYFTRNLFANVNFFRIETKDEIFYNPAAFDNENLEAKTRRDGIEVSLGFDYNEISLRGTYTYRDTEIRGGEFSGKEVPNVPRHQASIDIVWRPLERLSVAFNGIYVGERLLDSDFTNAFPEQGGYTVVNMKLKYTWQKFTAFLDMNNLFDKEYAAYGVLATTPVEPAFYPSPKFNFLAGIKLNY